VCPPEKSRDSDAFQCGVVRSLQSGLSRKNREIRARFAHFGETKGENSLRSRLRGGAGDIRTLGTGLKAARADVCVSYTESEASTILCDCLLAAQSSLTSEFLKWFEGESLGILCLKVITPELFNRPGYLARDCLPSGQSRDRNSLQRKELFEAGISNKIRRSCSHFLGRNRSTRPQRRRAPGRERHQHSLRSNSLRAVHFARATPRCANAPVQQFGTGIRSCLSRKSLMQASELCAQLTRILWIVLPLQAPFCGGWPVLDRPWLQVRI
jgi:hypothetical protein